MMSSTLSRRRMLATGLAISALGGLGAQASEAPIEISWGDLIPESEKGDYLARAYKELTIVPHSAIVGPMEQDLNASVTTKYNGKTVILPGYALPMSFANNGIKEFLLVPFVGACIHVPPPPPNQLVIVTVDTPYRPDGPFAPVLVTGVLQTEAVSTDLAEIGYTMQASRIERYDSAY